MKYLRLIIVVLVLAMAGCAEPAGPGATPSPSNTQSSSASPSTPESPSPTPTTADCTKAPPQSAFAVGTSNQCFVTMSQRFPLWLGENTVPDGKATEAGADFTADTQTNVKNVQRIMGDSPDGWLGQRQWTRLLTQNPPPITQLRTTGLGPLWFGMTGDQLNASGYGKTSTDPELPPYADIIGAQAVGCYDGKTFYAAYVKGPSDVSTIEGITSASTVADLQRTFGKRLLTLTSQTFPDFVEYAVVDGDYGYLFIPQPDGTLMIMAGESRVVELKNTGPHGICGY